MRIDWGTAADVVTIAVGTLLIWDRLKPKRKPHKRRRGKRKRK